MEIQITRKTPAACFDLVFPSGQFLNPAFLFFSDDSKTISFEIQKSNPNCQRGDAGKAISPDLTAIALDAKALANSLNSLCGGGHLIHVAERGTQWEQRAALALDEIHRHGSPATYTLVTLDSFIEDPVTYQAIKARATTLYAGNDPLKIVKATRQAILEVPF